MQKNVLSKKKIKMKREQPLDFTDAICSQDWFQ